MGNKIASERAQPHYLAHCATKLGLLRASPGRKKSMDSIAYSSNDPQKMKRLKVGFLSLGVVGIYYLAAFINATENVPRCHQCPPGPNMRASWTGWTRSKDEGNESCSVMSNSWRPHGLYSRWNSPGQNTGVGSLSLHQGIFPMQGSNPGLLHCRQILYPLSPKGGPRGAQEQGWGDAKGQ